MKDIESKLVMRVSAAAVALALGAATAFAQQQGAGDQSRQQQQSGAAQSQQQGAQPQGAQQDQGAQQQQRAQQQDRAEQQGAQRQRDAEQRVAAAQQREGEGQLDQVAEDHEELGTFVAALEQAGLAEELTGSTPYTIFAPTDEAFEAMGQDASELMQPENREQLIALLRGHIVADDVDPQMARQLTEARTIDGETIELSTEGDKLMVGDASVVTPNIQVQDSNLRIYTIDKVLGEGRQTAAAGGSNRDRG